MSLKKPNIYINDVNVEVKVDVFMLPCVSPTAPVSFSSFLDPKEKDSNPVCTSDNQRAAHVHLRHCVWEKIGGKLLYLN